MWNAFLKINILAFYHPPMAKILALCLCNVADIMSVDRYTYKLQPNLTYRLQPIAAYILTTRAPVHMRFNGFVIIFYIELLLLLLYCKYSVCATAHNKCQCPHKNGKQARLYLNKYLLRGGGGAAGLKCLNGI